METETLVYVDLEGVTHLVGRLWTRTRRGKESASFEYDASWLERPDRFSLEPALTLDPGPFHARPGAALFGAIGDSAPDRWGRVLMRRAERRRAERVGTPPRTLRELDYLLLVDDEARQGALRFKAKADGPFLAECDRVRIPPLLELPRLLSAADRVAAGSGTDEDLQLLLAPGSSLGGARPKASVRDRDGRLALAKFPHKDDEISAVLWEAVALKLAASAGITVSTWRIETAGDRPVLLLARFDREGETRIPFLSALSMLDASDHEVRSYLEIADALRRHGAATTGDMHELWRRMVFNVLISNTDDHLRNHGFLHAGGDGWRLSPAYDLNPVPVDIKPRVLATAIDIDDGTASLDLAMNVAAYFELDLDEARGIAREVGTAVKAWRRVAARLHISAVEINRIASAFEHEDLRAALRGA